MARKPSSWVACGKRACGGTSSRKPWVRSAVGNELCHVCQSERAVWRSSEISAANEDGPNLASVDCMRLRVEADHFTPLFLAALGLATLGACSGTLATEGTDGGPGSGRS